MIVPTIRRAQPDDEAGVSALLSACYPVLLSGAYPPDVLAEALPLMTRANPRLLASGTFYVAETPDGRLTGCGGWTVETPGTGTIAPGVGHIRHFAVDPNVSRRGIGRALMDATLAAARMAGMRELHCFATLNARSFYEAMGFEPVADHVVMLGEQTPFPCLFMRQTLA